MSIQVSAMVENVEAGDRSKASQQRDAYLARLLTLAKTAPLSLNWLGELRDYAAVRVGEQAFPSPRDEEWRFTDLSPLLQVAVESATGCAVTADAIAPFTLPEAANSRLVFVDGVYAPELSAIANLPETLVVGNLVGLSAEWGDRLRPYLAKQSGAEELFTALNTAGLNDAAVILLPKNLVVDQPIHLLFVSTADSTPRFSQPRCLVVAESNSAVTLVEEFISVGEGITFTNTVTEIWVNENAQVNHTRLQRHPDTSLHIGKTAVSQARAARYTCNAISLGAKLSRHNLEIYQTGEQTETYLNGLTMIAGEQESDMHSAIALTKPYGMTRQLQKCIIDDRAHAVFNGRVFVPQAAQLTDAGQLNRNLLLSPKARIDTKPQLEIVADNVKCTHGAAVGQLDADEIFYLQSRGIDAAQARKLLVYAFAYEVLEQIPVESLRQTLSQFVNLHT